MGLIHRMQFVFAFELNNHALVDDQIRPEAALQLYAFVNNRHRLLPLDANAKFLELVGNASFVSRFE